MADLILPPSLHIANSKVRYIDNTGVSVGAYTGFVKTASLGGDRLAMAMTFTTVGGASSGGRQDRAVLTAFMAWLRGRQARFYSWDRSYRQRGSFPATELLANPEMSGTTNWSSPGGIAALTASSQVMRSTLVATSADTTIRADSVSVTNGAAYAIRAMVNTGKGPLKYRANLGSTAGATDYAVSAADITSDSLTTACGTVGSTTAHASIAQKITGSPASAVGDFMQIAYASLSRCARANGAASAGASGMLLKNLPTSTDDLLMTGDQVEVITANGSELKILSAPLNSDSSGYGYVLFNPPLRGAAGDNAIVIIYRPCGRWVCSGQVPEWSNDPGVITSATLEFEEAA